MRKSNRVAIITGASRGLGEVIACVLAKRRYDLVIGGRDAAALRHVMEALSVPGSRVVPVDGDVIEASVRARLVNAARQLGGLNLLINNASALGVIGPLLEFDVQQFGRVFPVNVGAPIALIQQSVPLLAERHGLIVNITSDAAQGAYPGWGPYGASKAALDLLTRTLAIELRDRGVSAVIVDPGDMRTRMHQEAFPLEDISDRPLPEVTMPFWNWLFDQNPEDVHGERFAAQAEDRRWLQRAS
jgi:NAD(P)-dependent dehydrogenase (short-subunit alcohol dehydrogenase family)